MKLAALVLPFVLISQQQPLSATQPQSRGPVVLITAGDEQEVSASASGAATKVGNTDLGTVNGKASAYVHNEVWEVVRRFEQDCQSATFITNPTTPHTLTIHVDYERLHGWMVDRLYQLALLDAAGNPLYVGKKNYLYRQIKPVCSAIQMQH